MNKSTRRAIAPAAVVALALVLSACGGSGTAKSPVSAPEFFTRVSEGSLSASQSIQVPGEPVLDLLGLISRTNRKGALSMDLATLETMPIVTGSIFEPFVKQETTFSGVLLSDVLNAAGTAAGAKEIFITALDDYTWTLPISVARSGEVLLATRENDEQIPIDKGGPIRIVFSDDSATGKETDSWVWSVRSVEVR